MSNRETYAGASNNQLPPVPDFSGSSGAACEEFIRALRIRAAAANQQDGAWILNEMVYRLSGPAMRWHASLHSSIREDWDSMVAALLTEYPAEDSDGNPIIPRPVEPPIHDSYLVTQLTRRTRFPLKPGLWEGRFRLESDDAPSGKIWLSFNPNSKNMELTSNVASAVRVRFKSRGTHPYNIFVPIANTRMIIKKSWFLRVSGGGNGNRICVDEGHAGPVWTVDSRGRLQAKYQPKKDNAEVVMADLFIAYLGSLEVELTTLDELQRVLREKGVMDDYLSGHLVFEPL